MGKKLLRGEGGQQVSQRQAEKCRTESFFGPTPAEAARREIQAAKAKLKPVKASGSGAPALGLQAAAAALIKGLLAAPGIQANKWPLTSTTPWKSTARCLAMQLLH